MVKKVTLIKQKKGLYRSFPTLFLNQEKVHIFYREASTGFGLVHGFKGRVLNINLELKDLLLSFSQNESSALDIKPLTVFESENEIDSIASKINDQCFTLSTRQFFKDKPMRVFNSIAQKPEFNSREELKVDGLKWFAFYGKAFAFKDEIILPAYGELIDNSVRCRPILLSLKNDSLKLVSYLPSDINGSILNESSIAFYDGSYHIFMRQDTMEFGIWHAFSDNLVNWSSPTKLFDKAQAPLFSAQKGKPFLTCRYFKEEGKTQLIGCDPFNYEKSRFVIDEYGGNPYDGAYSDHLETDAGTLVIYYKGNEEGEPSIEIALL